MTSSIRFTSVVQEHSLTFVDLVLETARQHLISLIQAENLDIVGPQSPSVDHIINAPGCSNDDVDALLELGHVVTNVGSTDTGVTFDIHVIAQRDHDFLDLLRKLSGRGKNQGLSTLDAHIKL